MNKVCILYLGDGIIKIRTFCNEGCPDKVSLYHDVLFIQGQSNRGAILIILGQYNKWLIAKMNICICICHRWTITMFIYTESIFILNFKMVKWNACLQGKNLILLLFYMCFMMHQIMKWISLVADLVIVDACPAYVCNAADSMIFQALESTKCGWS
jgi:hypothetical protein